MPPAHGGAERPPRGSEATARTAGRERGGTVTSNAAPQPDSLALPDSSAATEGATPHAGWLRARWARVRATGEAGMSTAEYAVGTVVICGRIRAVGTGADPRVVSVGAAIQQVQS
ncbi:DUF4244 domain-containing protein [Geodermatophilus sp. CPCC 205761]|uniref:DUF4244 domain-containing protein n=1 Tax=Geodermatophilus sp. CPCC 205761 TaxID=2936597 RepID=UPI003F52BC4C